MKTSIFGRCTPPRALKYTFFIRTHCPGTKVQVTGGDNTFIYLISWNYYKVPRPSTIAGILLLAGGGSYGIIMVSGLKRKCPPGNQKNYMNDNHLISCYFQYNRERFSKKNPPLHKILTFYETFWAGQSSGKLGKLSISPVYECLLPDHYFH